MAISDTTGLQTALDNNLSNPFADTLQVQDLTTAYNTTPIGLNSFIATTINTTTELEDRTQNQSAVANQTSFVGVVKSDGLEDLTGSSLITMDSTDIHLIANDVEISASTTTVQNELTANDIKTEIIEFPATGTPESYPYSFNAAALPATSQLSGPTNNVFANDGSVANIETTGTFDSNATTHLYFRITQGAKLTFGMLLHNNYSRLTDLRTANLSIFSNEQYMFNQALGGSTIEFWKKGVLNQTVAGTFSVGHQYRVSIINNVITLALLENFAYSSIGSPMTIDTPSVNCVGVVGDYGANVPNGDYTDEAVVEIYEPAIILPAVKIEKVGNDFQIGTNISIEIGRAHV